MTERRNLHSVLDALQSGACVITSNTRAARNLKRAFADRQRQLNRAVWQSPQVLPWSAWLKHLWQEHLFRSTGQFSALLDARQEHFVWERIIAADSAGMDAESLAEQCARAWRTLFAYRIPREKNAFRRKPDTAAFFRWSSSYDSLCERNGWLDEARLPDQLHTTAVDAAGSGEIVFWGFDRFTPQQQALIAVLEAAGIRCPVGGPDGEQANASRLALEDSRAELKAAALWAREVLEHKPGATVGIAIPNLEDLRGAAEHVFLQVLHPGALTVGGSATRRAFEISLGVPLAQVPIITAALSLLELAARPQSVEFVGRLLRSPFIGDGEELSARALLDAGIRAQGFTELSLEQLRDLANRPTACRGFAIDMRAFCSAVAKLGPRRTPSRWSRDVLPTLASAGWPGTRSVNSREYQAQRAFTELLSDFARLDLVADSFDFATMVRRLARTAEEKLFQPENLGAPVQILGIIEAAGSRFDHLWIAGMHAAAWPPEAHPSPFIPIDLQRAHRVPGASAAERLEYARETLQRLMGSGEEIVVSYPTRQDDVVLTATPLIADLPEVARDKVLHPAQDYEMRLFGSATTETESDERAPIVTEPVSRGGTKIFKLQAACPFRAFAELRLEARELQSPRAGVDPKLRGQLLHRALQLIWEELQSQSNLQARNQAQLEELVGRNIDRSLKESEATLLEGWRRQVVEIERERLTDLVLRLLELEKQRPAPFRVAQRELTQEVTLGGITTEVKIDRIDELEGGGLVLLDYKSGEPKVNHWDGERPEDPQVPIYATELGSAVAAAGFVQINQKAIAFKGYAKQPGMLPYPVLDFQTMSEKKRPAPTFDEMLQNWRETLEKLGREFLNGESKVDPKNGKKTCELCHLGMFCRVSEARVEADEEADDAG
jgi:ATP-dependent helicase/nuclease subunit B